MKKLLSLLVVFVLVGVLLASAPQNTSQKPKPLYASDLVKIKLSQEALSITTLPTEMYAEANRFNINELDQLFARNGGIKIIRAHRQVFDKVWQEKTGFDRWFLVKIDGSTPVEEAIKNFKNNRYVEEAIPEYYAYTTAVPNDTFYANNWGHNNTAQLPVYSGGSHSGAGVGTIGFDSDAQLAWDQSQGYGSASIVIAILDTGVDLTHPDLRLVTGYDYGDNDSNPSDDSASPNHGTACSGVAAGRANNTLGVAGIAGGCSVMPLKIASSDGSLGFTAIENSLTHCGDYNVDVASMSFGAEGGMVEGNSPSTDAALEYAYSHGVTLFAATANSNASTMAYPSNHNKVISVGAASPTGQRKSTTSSDGEYWWGSNYGVATQDNQNAVDIMAPTILPATDRVGSVGYSTTDYYMWFNGTSCATPYAAGVAGLILSKDPSLTPAQVRSVITSTATDMTFDGGAGWDRYTGYGMVNANNALLSLVPGMPSCQITSPLNGSVHDLNSTIAVTALASDTDGSITQVRFYVNDVLQNTDNSAPYTWNWNTTGYSGGTHNIKAVATDNSANTAQHVIGVTLLAPADEGFESGSFSAFSWVQSGNLPWQIQTADVFSGTYAAKSGAITHNQTSSMEVSMNVTSAGNISFYQKVSSEADYDYLRFYIDDVLQNQWAGAGNWTLQFYPVSTGFRTFKWTYYKDGSVSSNSDCGFVDHISFPPHAVYYAPPQSFAAVGGNGFAYLSWQAPGGAPTGYKIFRNGTLLTTVTGLNYTDNAVVNGTTYGYYLKAVYAGGESDATSTINVTPNSVVSAIIGSGTSTTGTDVGCPINIWYKSLHGQSVYTAAELNAAGVFGPININEIGFYINSAPSLALPNFVVRMKHTTATNVSSWQTADNMVTVYSNPSYMPTVGGYQMLTLSSPFLWNGTDNLVVDTAFGLVANYSQTGTVQYSTVTSGYRYVRSDSVDQTNVFTGESVTSYRPNIKLSVIPNNSGPIIVVNPTTLAYGDQIVGTSSTMQFTIQNTGDETLTGTITTPNGYSVALRSRSEGVDVTSQRNVLPFSISAGQSNTYNLSFQPTSVTAYNGNVVISSNATNSATVNIAVSGNGYVPPTISVDTTHQSAILNVGETGEDYFTIGNLGSQNLTYSMQISPVRSQIDSASSRSIAGSTLTMDALDYLPGTTVNWTFTVYNASPDTEWLKDIFLSFPAGVTVNTVGNFVGGSGGDLIPSPTSGNGITVNWHGVDGSGWGLIRGGETAVATVNVTISGGFSGDIVLPYQLDGDIYGADPHVLTGSINLPQYVIPVNWFSVSPLSGSIAGGGNEMITGSFTAVGMAPGTYNALLTISSNDPNTPSSLINVQMVVNDDITTLATPELSITRNGVNANLSWNTVEHADEYWVYRASEPNGTFLLLGVTVDLQYTDTDGWEKAFYYVKAIRFPN